MFSLVRHLVPEWSLNLLLRPLCLLFELSDASLCFGVMMTVILPVVIISLEYEIFRPFQSMILHDALYKRLPFQTIS